MILVKLSSMCSPISTRSKVNNHITPLFFVLTQFLYRLDHEYDCPFCFAHVQIILSTTLLIGDATQLDYSRAPDKTTKQSLLTNSAASMQRSEDDDDHKPKLLFTKYQRLKNSATKLAKVLIVDENPVQAAPNTQMITRDTTGFSQTQQSFLGDTHTKDEELSSLRQTQQPAVSIAYYPEKLHSVQQEQCEALNARVMKQLMKQKMQKNQTFYQAKMIASSNRVTVTSAALPRKSAPSPINKK